jgi:hypothetical protein
MYCKQFLSNMDFSITTGFYRSADWFGEFYIATYTRASPYIYGILFGYFMYSFSDYNRKTGEKIPSVRIV